MSIVFGIIALVRIRRTGQPGKGLAITGLVVGGAGLVLGSVGLFYAIIDDAERGTGGEITEAGDVSLEDLRPGDCIGESAAGQAVLTVRAVPCADPHEAEVFAVFDVVATGGWPGDGAMTAEADRCVDLLAEDFPAAYADEQVDTYYFVPSHGTWREGDRAVICIAQFLDGPRSGPLRG